MKAERLTHPRVANDALRYLPDCYKIKIITPQFRLIHKVSDAMNLLTNLSVASRDDVNDQVRARL